MVACLRDKLYRRGGHVTFQFENEMFIWGGIVEHLPKGAKQPNSIPTNSNDFHSSHELFAYNPCSHSWRRITTAGDVPPRTLGASETVSDGCLYIFGGYHGYSDDPYAMDGYSNLLFRLNLNSFFWKNLTLKKNPNSSSISEPLSVENTSLFKFGYYLYTFGGYGDKPSYVTDQFVIDPVSHSSWLRGWSSMVFRFHIQNQFWERVKTTGRSPSPRAGHGSALVKDQLIVFGGRSKERRVNDIYILNLTSMTWIQIWEGYQPPNLLHWLDTSCHDGILDTEDGKIVPEPRALHSLTHIPSKSPTFFVYGGIGLLCAPLNDAWILHIDDDYTFQWEYFPLRYDHGEVRCWHGACCIPQGSEILIHSGLTQEFYLNRLDLDNHAESILSFQFGVKTLFRIAFDFVTKNAERFSNEDLKQLPVTIQGMLSDRLLDDDAFDSNSNPPTDPPFERRILHSGV